MKSQTRMHSPKSGFRSQEQRKRTFAGRALKYYYGRTGNQQTSVENSFESSEVGGGTSRENTVHSYNIDIVSYVNPK